MRTMRACSGTVRVCTGMGQGVWLRNGLGIAVVAGLSLKRGGGGGNGCVLPTETNVHGDALCFMVMGPSLLQRLAVGGWWLAVGGWRLAVGGPWGVSLRAVLDKKEIRVLKDSPGL